MFNFNLVARDGGTPALTAVAPVKIMLTNKPDEAPVFINVREVDGGYYERISESVTDDTIVAKVDAIDPDGIGQIRYFFQETSATNPFFIDEKTGIVKKRVGKSLDQLEYRLKVRAVDDVTAVRGDSKKESVAPLTIEVLEENNDKPHFKDCDKMRYVRNHGLGFLITPWKAFLKPVLSAFLDKK